MTDPRPPGLPEDTMNALWAELEQLIAGSHLFRSLDAEGRRSLMERGRLVSFAPKSEIVREGDQGDCFYLIDRGVVEVHTRTEQTGEIALTTLQRGAFFGEVSVLTGSPRTASVSALTDVWAVAFDRPLVEEILARDPKAKRLLDAMIRGRAKDAAEKIARALDASGEPSGDPDPNTPGSG